MKSTIKISSSLFILIFCLNISKAQSPVSMIYQGVLNSEGNEAISHKNIMLKITFLTPSNEEITYKDTLKTDELGSFSYALYDIPKMFNKTGNEIVRANIEIDLLENVKGVESITDVEYSLSKEIQKKQYAYKMVRNSDFKEMYSIQKRDNWGFSDEYPFGHLCSAFKFTTQEGKTEAKNIDVTFDEKKCCIPFPSKTRGLKGGFAVGGYKTN